ncbi:ImmA/IrrE family metallo-endopeptidase [Haliea sp. E1-2-M8]|uniref:ImmA/IrrE family metallo-endopeptidase n=1 Tax=Haliea sp. E1-2-M8 TaxID=3064706 RepID=UPI00272866D6|nr:ImmA/IrrE family metallo-endopeptidase [Haliea sp. E1-2-M8]MDO8864191.1 ImmA/IrrE family metallo-endopeptidase [Haliea sp. E1-2-M8]
MQKIRYKPKGYKVKPRGREKVRHLAHGFSDVIREVMGVSSVALPVVDVIEFLDYRGVLELDVVEAADLGYEAAAETIPGRGDDPPLMRIENGVFERAVEGGNFERFTIAHELGHFFMHMDEPIVFARGVPDHRPFEDSEWQANAFAGELLVDSRIVVAEGYTTEFEICRQLGVSSETAAIQWAELKKNGIV